MKKETKTYSAIILVIAIIIAVILDIKYAGNNVEKQELLCLSQKAKLYVSSTCGHCANQEAILSTALKKYDLDLTEFDITVCDLDENRKICNENNIIGVPSWIINNTKYEGVKNLNELIKLAGC